MTVFTVVDSVYRQARFVGVFSTREKAEEVKASHCKNHYYSGKDVNYVYIYKSQVDAIQVG